MVRRGGRVTDLEAGETHERLQEALKGQADAREATPGRVGRGDTRARRAEAEGGVDDAYVRPEQLQLIEQLLPALEAQQRADGLAVGALLRTLDFWRRGGGDRLE